MAKFVEWVDPIDDCIPVICRMTLKDVVHYQFKRQPKYISAEQAIADFIVVNWGIIKEYE